MDPIEEVARKIRLGQNAAPKVWCWQCGRMMFVGDEHTDNDKNYCPGCCPVCEGALGEPL
jgi:hypothetical protein